jgi:hypothetical protein
MVYFRYIIVKNAYDYDKKHKIIFEKKKIDLTKNATIKTLKENKIVPGFSQIKNTYLD